MFKRSSNPIYISSSFETSFDTTSSSDSLDYHFTDVAFHFTQPIAIIITQRSRDKSSIEQVHILDVALDDLKWIHPNVKMTMASNELHNKAIIKDLE